MYSPSPRSHWRRLLSALLFMASYRGRMLWLNLRYKLRTRNVSLHQQTPVMAQPVGNSWHQQRPFFTSPARSSISSPTAQADSLSGMLTLHLLEDSFPQQPGAETQALHLAPSSKPSFPQRFIGKRKSIPRKIILMLLGILVALLVGQTAWSVLDSSLIHSINGVSFSAVPRLAAAGPPIDAHKMFANASKNVVRISQLDRAQYASEAEFNTWAYSACSTASMTVVFNAYGNHYRITDVLKVESELGEITPQLGLVEDIGIARTAERFGFATNWSDSWTLDQVLASANAGYPVIVGWPPSLYTGGHLVVVTGGDADWVYLADSSLWNYQQISHSQFLKWWAGFAAVVTPDS